LGSILNSDIIKLSALKSAIIRDLLVVDRAATVMEAIALMSSGRSQCDADSNSDIHQQEFLQESRSSCVFVVEDRKVIGIMTERDVVRLSAQTQNLDLLLVSEVMAQPLVTLHESALTDLFLAVNLIQQFHIRHLPILDEQDCLVGMVTNESLRQVSRPIDLMRLRLVSEVMTGDVVCATPDCSMLAIAQLIATQNVSSVIIVEEIADETSLRRPIGIVTERDIVQFQALGLNLANYQASTVMSAPIFAVTKEDTLWTVHQIMEQRLIRRLAVTGELGELLGIVTQTSLLNALNPTEIYNLAKILEVKVLQLESEKLALLEDRNDELERQVTERTISLQKKAERERLVAEIADRIRVSMNLQEVLDICVTEVRAFLQCDRVMVYQFQPDWSGLIIAESVDRDLPLYLGRHIQDSCFQEQTSTLYAHDTPISVNNIYTAGYTDCHVRLLEEYQVKSNVVVPIRASGGLWGLLIGHQCTNYRDWQADDVRFLQDISVQFAIVIQQAIAYEKLQAELRVREVSEALIQQQLIESIAWQDRYETVGQVVGQVLYEYNFSTAAITWGANANLIFGYAYSELPLQLDGWMNLVHHEDRSHFQEVLERTSVDKTPLFAQYRVLHRDGHYIWMEDRNQRLYDLMGNGIGVIGAIADISDRKQAEAELKELNASLEARVESRTIELQEREAQLRDLFDNATDLIQSISPEGKFLFVNQAWQETLGYSEAELEHLSIFQIIHPEDLTHCQTAMQRLFTGEKFIGIETRFLTKDGRMIVVEGNVNCQLKDGIPISTRGIFRDITERNEAEKALEESRRLLQTVLDSFPLAVFWKDRQSVLLGCNHLFVKTSGLESPLDVIGKNNFEFSYTEEEALKYTLDDREVMESGVAKIGIQETITLPNGNISWLETNKIPLQDSLGEVVGVVCTFQDISDRKQAEQIILQQANRETLLRGITQRIRQSLDLSIIFDTACQEIQQLLQCDRVGIFKFYPESNFNDGEFVAESVVDGFSSAMEVHIHDHCFGEDYAAAYAQGRMQVVNDIDNAGLTDCHRDILSQFQVRANLVIPLLCGNNLWGLVCIHQCVHTRQWQEHEINLVQQIANQLAIAIQQASLYAQSQQEIAERQQAQQQLTEANQQLARATRLKDEFLANMSHELRTPLNAILGLSNALKEKLLGSLTQPQLNAIGIVESSGIHLLELINDILDLSKISSGMLELKIEPASVPNLCDSSLVFIKQQAFQKEVEIYSHIPQNINKIDVEERRIKQVLINLLNNAVKFTPSGGKVSLLVAIGSGDTWQGEATIPQQIRAMNSPAIVFQVTDTGIGIAPEDLQRLFQPFMQLDSALNRQYEGTGLGLALVKKIVELHGGQVIAESQIGIGSCFTVALPYEMFGSSDPSTDMPDATRRSIAGNSGKAIVPLILLAEDNEANIATLTAYLTALNYRVVLKRKGCRKISR
jgi:PAS domain S-box-containing protein